MKGQVSNVKNRTLIKVSAGENCIGFRTISWHRKSHREFLITRDEFAQLEHGRTVITQDIHSFAVLRRRKEAETLSIDFSWLSGGSNDQIMGWEQNVILPYYALAGFVRESTQEGGPTKWQTLSLQTVSRPKIEFTDKAGLRECLENRIVRRKLSRALRDNFYGAERVVLYHDFEAYSFMFRSFRGDWPAVTGGLILHGREDLKKAHYSVHT